MLAGVKRAMPDTAGLRCGMPQKCQCRLPRRALWRSAAFLSMGL